MLKRLISLSALLLLWSPYVLAHLHYSFEGDSLVFGEENQTPRVMTVADLAQITKQPQSPDFHNLEKFLGVHSGDLLQMEDILGLQSPGSGITKNGLFGIAKNYNIPLAHIVTDHIHSFPIHQDRFDESKNFRFQVYYDEHGLPKEQLYAHVAGQDAWVLAHGPYWDDLLKNHRQELMEYLGLSDSAFLDANSKTIREHGLYRKSVPQGWVHQIFHNTYSGECNSEGDLNLFQIYTKKLADSHKILTRVSQAEADRQVLARKKDWDPDFTGEENYQPERHHEDIIVSEYTSLAGYGAFNRHMRKQIPFTYEGESLNNVFVSAIRKAPLYSGQNVLKRVAPLDQKQFDQFIKLKPGDLVTDRAIMSTTYKEKTDGFFAGGELSANIEVHNSLTGRDIQGGDAEVVFEPFSTFQVEKFDPKTSTLTVKEVPRDIKIPYKDMIIK